MKKNDVSKVVRKGTIVLMAVGLAPIFPIDSVNGEASTNLPEEFSGKNTISTIKGVESPGIDRLTTSANPVIGGTGVAGATVVITAGDQEIGRGTVFITGQYSIPILKQVAGTKLSVTQSIEGDTSTAREIKVPEPIISMPTTISSNEVSYRGIARRGFSKIRVYDETNQLVAQTTAIGSGSFVFSMPKQVPGSKLTLIATAGAELESRGIAVVKGLDAPQAGKVTAFQTKVSGVGAAKAKISIKAGGVEIGTGTVAANGAYEIMIPKQPEETKLLITQISGRDISPAKEVIVTTGAKPAITNNLTTNSTEVNGTGEKGATIHVKVAGKEIGTGEVTAEGVYSVRIPRQAVNAQVSITQSEEGATSEALEVTVAQGIVAPGIDRLTTSANPIIGGTGVAGATIIVKAGDQEIGRGTVFITGQYSIPILKQVAGTTLSAVQSKDGDTSIAREIKVPDPIVSMPTTISSNEVSYRGVARRGFSKISLYNEQKQIIAQTTAIGSGSFVFSMPKQAPGSKLTLVATAGAELESRDITVVKGLDAPKAGKVTALHTKVSGVGTSGATISVKADGKEIGTGNIAVNGTYEVVIPRQLEGTQLLITQVSGRDISPAEGVTVSKGLEQPTINAVTHNSTTVNGTGTAGATISVKINGSEVGSTTVNADGDYQIAIPQQRENTKMRIEQSKNGDISVPQELAVITGLSVNTFATNSTEVSGTGVLGATITIESNNQVVGTGKVNANGLYSIPIPKQQEGTLLRATQSEGPLETIEITVSATNQNKEDLVATSVADFGANALDPESTLDQSTKLQNIINQAATANKKVYIPEGTYIINKSLKLKTNMNLKGDATRGTILKNTSGAGVIFDGSDYAEEKNVSINNLLLDGIGISARVATNISITNNIFYNPNPGFNIVLYASDNAVIKSNIFMRDAKHTAPGTGNTTIYVSGFATGGTYKHMQNTQIEGNVIGLKISELSGMKSVSPDATKATITKLQTLAESKKIDVTEDDQNYISTGINSYNTLKNAKINRNFFYSNNNVGQDHAIYLRGSQNIDFVGNHVRGFHNGVAGGVKFKSGRNILIMNNYFRNTGIIMYGTAEYGLADTYTSVSELSNWLVAGNTFDWKKWEDSYAFGMELNWATRTPNTHNGVFISNAYINYQNIPSNRRVGLGLTTDGVGFFSADSYVAGNTRDDTADRILKVPGWSDDYQDLIPNKKAWEKVLPADMTSKYEEYSNIFTPLRDNLR